jgi:hypothetical protein
MVWPSTSIDNDKLPLGLAEYMRIERWAMKIIDRQTEDQSTLFQVPGKNHVYMCAPILPIEISREPMHLVDMQPLVDNPLHPHKPTCTPKCSTYDANNGLCCHILAAAVRYNYPINRYFSLFANTPNSVNLTKVALATYPHKKAGKKSPNYKYAPVYVNYKYNAHRINVNSCAGQEITTPRTLCNTGKTDHFLQDQLFRLPTRNIALVYICERPGEAPNVAYAKAILLLKQSDHICIYIGRHKQQYLSQGAQDSPN